MNQIQKALAEVLEKYGTTDWKGRQIAKIALHRVCEYNLENSETLLTLPWAFDDSDTLKYSVRRIDEVINLEVWK